MPNASYVQSNFLGGEWSKTYQGRIDHPKYRTAMNVCLNGIPLEEGAWVRRPGTRYCGCTKAGNPGRVMDVTYTQGEPYTIEFTDGFVRFRNGTVFVKQKDYVAITNVTTASPAVVQIAQARTSWTVGTEVVFVFQNAATNMPYGAKCNNRVFSIASIDSTGTQITLNDAVTGAALNGTDANWTSALQCQLARVVVLASPYTSQSWWNNRIVQESNESDDFIIIFNKAVSTQVIEAVDDSCGPDFTQFTFQTSDIGYGAKGPFRDGPYLDAPTTGTTITPSGTSGSITLTLVNPGWSSTTTYKQGDVVTESGYAYQSLANANLNNTPSSTSTYWALVNTGIAVSPAGFLSSDIGRQIRLHSEPAAWSASTAYVAGNNVKYAGTYWTALASTTGVAPGSNAADWYVNTGAATWVWAIITAVTNSYTVTVSLVVDPDLGGALLYNATINEWRVGVYSDTTGWPTNGVIHEGRLWMVGIKNRFDASKSNDIFNFQPTAADGTVADDSAISGVFDSNDANNIYWLASDEIGVIGGTAAEEWLIRASELNNPITPTNIQAKKVTKYGSANIQPVRTPLSIVFAQRYGRKAYELIKDVFTQKFAAPNLSVSSRHLTSSGIAELAYQQERTPIIWARTNDGSLVGCTYRRMSSFATEEPNFVGWHRHAHGSSRLIKSICTAPTLAGTWDTLYATTSNSDGTGPWHVEAITAITEEDGTLPEMWFCDDAVTPVAQQTTTQNGKSGVMLYGMSHLAGKTVQVFGQGYDCGDYVVAADGTVFVPFSTYFTSNGLAPVETTDNHYQTMGVYIDEDPVLTPAQVFPTSQYLWVAGSSCEIMRWNLSDTGNTSPEVNIQGTTTTLTGPKGGNDSFTYAMAVDSQGYRYALNYALQTDSSVRYYVPIFSPTATGNVAPFATIEGANTGFYQFTTAEAPCGGLCLDAEDNVYVGLGNTIWKLPAGSTGNATATNFMTDTSIAQVNGQGISSLVFDRVRNWIWMTIGSTTLWGLRAYSLDGTKQRDITYPQTTGSNAPSQVAIGPDGSIYYTDLGMNMFKFAPSADTTATPEVTITGIGGYSSANAVGVAIENDGTIVLCATASIWTIPGSSSGAWSGITKTTTITGANTYLTAMQDSTLTWPQQLYIEANPGNFNPATVCSTLKDVIPIVVGYTFTSQGQCVRPDRPQETGALNGPAMGKKRRTHQYAAQIIKAVASQVSFGTDFTTAMPALFRYPNNTDYSPVTIYQDTHWSPLNDTYSFDSMLCWQITRPYPCDLASIGAYLETQDR